MHIITAAEMAIQEASAQTLAAIVHEVSLKHGVSIADLLSQRRDHRTVVARQEAYWRGRRETLASLPMIARFMRRIDHSTVMWGIKQHEKRTGAVGG